MSLTFQQIGVVHTPFTSRAGMPIQGRLAAGNTGKVELFEQWAGGLQDIEGFSHLILIYLFHRAEPCDRLQVKPFMDDQPHGIFAVRSPIRPNPIGLSVVKLLGREGCFLQVEGVDMLDGTPLIDIKPYFAKVDSVPEATCGWAARGLEDKGGHLSDDRFGS